MHKYFANTLFIGKQVLCLPSCHSTNDMTSNLVPEGKLFDGAVVLTNNQTSGRGQRGNSWEAEPGKNLTFSIFLKPGFLDITDQFFLNIIVSLGITDFLKDYLNEGVAIKWPNDIYYHDEKLGGILIENTIRNRQIEYTIVGIGLNINQRKFKTARAVSLAEICNQEFDLNALLHHLLLCIEQRYLLLKKNDVEKLHREYLSRLYWFEEKRLFRSVDFFAGEICGIDETGKLKVRTVEGVKTFNIKEISFVK